MRRSHIAQHPSASGGLHNKQSTSKGLPQGQVLGEDEATYALNMSIKHARYPVELVHQSRIKTEFVITLHATLFYLLQLLHLYRSVWWLPQSFQRRGVHLHLISVPLAIFVGTIFTHRLRLVVTTRITNRIISNVVTMFTTVVLLGYCLSRLYFEARTWVQLMYLVGPIPLFFLYTDKDFGLKKILFELNDDNKDVPLERHMHVCQGSFGLVVAECEHLKKRFNDRLAQVIVGAAVMSYYATFLPWGWSKALYYSVSVTSTHFLLAFLFSFTLLGSIYLGPGVTNVMQTAIMHVPPSYCPASLRRFRAVFASPSTVPRLLLALHLSLQFLTFSTLMANRTEWYAVVSLVVLLVLSMTTLKRMGRDYIVVWRVWDIFSRRIWFKND